MRIIGCVPAMSARDHTGVASCRGGDCAGGGARDGGTSNTALERCFFSCSVLAFGADGDNANFEFLVCLQVSSLILSRLVLPQ